MVVVVVVVMQHLALLLSAWGLLPPLQRGGVDLQHLWVLMCLRLLICRGGCSSCCCCIWR